MGGGFEMLKIPLRFLSHEVAESFSAWESVPWVELEGLDLLKQQKGIPVHQ